LGQLGGHLDGLPDVVHSRHPATAVPRQVAGRAAEAGAKVQHMAAGRGGEQIRELHRRRPAAAVQLVQRCQVVGVQR
ncbi:MAG: hypothetical protein J2P19_25530, partial [Pseudonocardia sp.]|nr:hypothetical protein [Pseudonocardia sp.]